MANVPQRSLKTMTITDPETSASSTESSTCKQKILTTIDCVNHVLIGFLTALTLFYSARSASTMDLHVTLCTVGYVLLMSEGIIWLAGDNVLTRPISRRVRSHVHWVLQVLGLVCILAGVIVMYQAKEKNKRGHFKSVHAILGLTSVVIMIVLAVCGYPVLVAVKLRKLIKPVIIKCTHNFLGIACLVLGMAAQILGYQMKWLPRESGSRELQTVTIVFASIITILSVRNALPNLFLQLAAIVGRRA
ncbi:transmembrane reductase CYB561D2 [Lasioglossum baleicum]|uniref:transmembrane reductase CYB561D2 n=1 Tax=Lasioglossum baleicum TaxID=434251 RepID=UPI003FCD994A